MLHPAHEACVCLLIWEWWLGHQKFIKASSTIGLVILFFTVLFFTIKPFFQKE